MAQLLAPAVTEQLLQHAAARATLAPSIHNSQPWRLVVHPRSLDVFADSDRQLTVLDPSGRELALSCGAALTGAELALNGAGVTTRTVLLPDPTQPALLASITVADEPLTVDETARRLDAAADSRHSNRREFSTDLVSPDVLKTLGEAGRQDGAWLHLLTDADDKIMVATLTQHADALQNADAAYRAELRAWTTDSPSRTDGVPASVVPHTTGQAHDDVPIRDFDTHGGGALPGGTHSSVDQTLAIVGTRGDTMTDWLTAGRALYRMLLELTDAGYQVSLFSQVLERPAIRQQLRDQLRLTGHPQIMFRAGVAEPTPGTPRRPLADVVSPAPGARPVAG